MLRSGSRGPDVEDLQRALMRKGVNPGPVDGVFGPKTEEAIRRFQERAGLVADGIAGPRTLGALAEAEAGDSGRGSADEEPDQGPPKQAL